MKIHRLYILSQKALEALTHGSSNVGVMEKGGLIEFYGRGLFQN